MPGPDEGAVLLQVAGVVEQLLDQAADQAALVPELGARIQETFGSWQAVADGAALHALFPLALTLCILHEHHEAATGQRAFRVSQVLVRTAVTAALVLGYGRVVGLITSVAGAGEFPGWGELLGWTKKGIPALLSNYDGIDDLPRLLLMACVWVLLLVCSLFAYVASLLLSVAQGVLVAILLALGKTCIVASLVPGVGLGKS
jgi:hypothetical protein